MEMNELIGLSLPLARVIDCLDRGISSMLSPYVYKRFERAKMIAEIAGNTKCDIQPCHSDEFPSPVKRPSYSVLDKTKIKETFGIKVPYWTDSLKMCMKNLMEA